MQDFLLLVFSILFYHEPNCLVYRSRIADDYPMWDLKSTHNKHLWKCTDTPPNIHVGECFKFQENNGQD